MLIKKACNREKRTMIRYAIEQEDGQTVRTDETDTKFFKRKRLETMSWAEVIPICKGNSMIEKYERK